MAVGGGGGGTVARRCRKSILSEDGTTGVPVVPESACCCCLSISCRHFKGVAVYPFVPPLAQISVLRVWAASGSVKRWSETEPRVLSPAGKGHRAPRTRRLQSSGSP